MNIKLTVFYEDPFWVGVFEKTCDGMYEASRVVFGSEPKDYEVYDFILQNFYKIRFSTPIPGEQAPEVRINPKRLQRQIKREVVDKGAGTKAQMAIKLQIEAGKQQRQKLSKAHKEAIEEEKFEMRQLKKKEKKKGH